MSAILAIDQGTSGTKAVVVDDADEIRGLAEIPIRPDYLPGGGVEQDPAALMDSVFAACRQAIAQAGIAIDAVAVSNQGETVLPWDPHTGNPLGPMVVWQDRRAEEICRPLEAKADWFTAKTGLTLDPYFSAPKIAWIRQNVTGEGVVTTSDTWMVHRLTGEFVTDAATASRSLLLDLDSADWDPELVKLFGLTSERLPAIVANDVVVGHTDAFGREAPVAGLVVDQQAALLAEACLEPGEAKCTFGTGAFLLANTGNSAARSDSGLVSCIAWRTDGRDTFCLDGQVYTAAAAVRWFCDLGLLADAAEIDLVAAPDAGGVLCVPALAGLASPWWRPDAGATLTGMTLSTTRSELVTALVQGLAAQVAEVCDLVGQETGQRLRQLRVDGGLTRSRRLMQAVADLAQVQIDVYPSAHATPLGAVALARKALDPSRSLADAVVSWKPSTSFVPEWDSGRAQEFRARWATALRSNLPERTS